MAHALLYSIVHVFLEVNHDHGRQSQYEGEEPHEAGDRAPVAPGPAEGVQRVHHSQIALRAHDGQDEDAGVHGDQIQAEQNAASDVAKVPVLRKIRPNHERDGGEVQQIRQSQVHNVDIHRSSYAHWGVHDDQGVNVSKYSYQTHDGQNCAEYGCY